MAILANLPKPLGTNTRKLAVAAGTTASSGAPTAAIVTGLSSIDNPSGVTGAGAAWASVSNSATAAPFVTATIGSITGGTVTVVGVSLGSSGAAAANSQVVNVFAIGH